MSHLDRLLAKQIELHTAATAGPDSDQQARPVTTTELPPFDVVCDYSNRCVAILFDADDITELAAHPLFAHVADQLHAAASAAEQEIEALIQTARDRQITQGLR